jgi:hypothetical protein
MYNVQRTHIISGGAELVKVPKFLLIVFTKLAGNFLPYRYFLASRVFPTAQLCGQFESRMLSFFYLQRRKECSTGCWKVGARKTLAPLRPVRAHLNLSIPTAQ